MGSEGILMVSTPFNGTHASTGTATGCTPTDDFDYANIIHESSIDINYLDIPYDMSRQVTPGWCSAKDRIPDLPFVRFDGSAMRRSARVGKRLVSPYRHFFFAA